MSDCELVEEFKVFGIALTRNDIISKCQALCSQHSIKADSLAAYWLGYAATNHYDDISLEYLDDFEKDLANQLKKSKPSSTAHPVGTPVLASKFMPTDDHILAAYGASPAAPVHRRCSFNSSDSDSPVRRPPSTPRGVVSRSSASSPLINGGLSPKVAKPSLRYSERTNSGSVVCSYFSDGVQQDDLSKKDWSRTPTHFKPKCHAGGLESNNNKIMFERLRNTAELAEDDILHIADEIAPAFGGADCWGSLNVASNEPVNCVGRICCDSNGKLNPVSIVMEGSREHSRAATVKLDLSRLSQFAVFPGQVVGVKGVNTTGECILVDDLIGGKVLEFPEQPITITEESGPVSIVVACGPFTTSDNLLYEPLVDLLDALSSSPPHILLLLGPILDAQHPLLSESTSTETYQGVVNRVLALISSGTENWDTQIFVVSSQRDVTSSGVFPTGPLYYDGNTSDQLHFISDPTMLVVEGVAIALTTMDVIMDLSKEEVAYPPQQGDRMIRLVRHILSQQMLYPVNPPPEHVCVANSLVQSFASIHYTPHFLILPSDIKNFVKEVNGCVAVNPERLCKGMSGGCYARLELHAPTPENPDRPVVIAAVFRV